MPSPSLGGVPAAWLVFLGQGNKFHRPAPARQDPVARLPDRVVLSRDFADRGIPWLDRWRRWTRWRSWRWGRKGRPGASWRRWPWGKVWWERGWG